MKVRVLVGFTKKTGETCERGSTVEVSDAHVAQLIERGLVEALDDKPKTSKRKSRAVKASKKNER